MTDQKDLEEKRDGYNGSVDDKVHNVTLTWYRSFERVYWYMMMLCTHVEK